MLKAPVLLMAFVFACCSVLTAQVSVTGVQSQIAGPWNGPVGVASDTSGNIYIAQFNSGPILKIDAQTHATSTFLSTAGGIALSGPQLLAIDSSNNLYIADSNNNRIVMYSIPNGSLTAVYPAPQPFVVSLDASNDIWVGGISSGSGYIAEIPVGSPTGTTPTSVITTGLDSPKGITFDSSGNLYVSDTTLNTVYEYAAPAFTSKTIFISSLSAPAGMLFDASNNLDITEVGGNGLYRYLAPGYTTAIQVSTGISESEGVAADPKGNLFVTAYGDSKVLEISNGGSFGQVPIGTTSASMGVNFQVTAGTTIGSFQYLDQGITGLEFKALSPDTNPSLCTTGAHPSTETCTLDVTFTPQFPGTRYGAVEVLDNSGNILATAYVSGTGSGPVAVVSPGGLSAVVGGGSTAPTTTPIAPASAYLKQPGQAAVDASGNMYIADTLNNLIEKVSASTGQLTVVAGGGSTLPSTTPMAATSARLSEPYSVAVDGAGNLYITDYSPDRLIEKVTTSGQIVLVAGGGSTSPSTTPIAATNARFSGPVIVAVDGAGNLYITDYLGARVDMVTASTGQIVVLAGGGSTVPSTTPVAATSAQLDQPLGLALDGSGNVYFSEAARNLVEKVTVSTGQLVVVAGGGSTAPSTTPVAATSAALSMPWGLALDAAGNLYVTDFGNNLVEKVTASTSQLVAVAGGGGTAPSTASIAATSVAVTNPETATLDGAGNLYIADSGNNLIEKVTASATGFTFPTATDTGTTDSADGPRTVTVSNNGNSALTIPPPTTGTNPSLATGFVLANSSSCPQLDTSSTDSTLAEGTSCTYAVEFMPTEGGTDSGSLTLTDNSLAVPSTQTVALTGNGVQTTDNTSTLVGASPNPVTAGQPVTITAAVSDTTNAGTVPTGSVTFTDTVGSTMVSLNGGTAVMLSSGTATVSATLSGIGVHTITANYAGVSNRFAAGTATTSVTVAAATSTLSFAPIATKTYGNPPFTVSATSASSGAVTYAVVSGPATISGNVVTLTGAGTVTLSASQAASGNYAAATATTSFTVTAEVSTLSFAPIAAQTYGSMSITVSASSASNGAVTYAVVSGPATISGNVVTLTGAGTVTLSASQAASGNYAAATATTSFTVAAMTPMLSFAPIAAQTYGSAPFTVSATSASSGAVTYAVVSGPATISGNVVTLTGAGTVTLSASQAATGNYAAATATTSFTVTDPIFTLTSASSSAAVLPGGLATYNLTLTPGSGSYPDELNLSATGVPAGATATFSPATIAAGSGTTSFTLTIQTSNSQTARNEKPSPGGPLAPVALGLLLLPLAGMKRVRRRLRQMPRLPVLLAVVALSLGAMVGLSGCGTSGGFFNQGAKSYSVVVTAKDAVTGVQNSTNVTLTVQ